jgi:hypothetical protein
LEWLCRSLDAAATLCAGKQGGEGLDDGREGEIGGEMRAIEGKRVVFSVERCVPWAGYKFYVMIKVGYNW